MKRTLLIATLIYLSLSLNAQTNAEGDLQVFTAQGQSILPPTQLLGELTTIPAGDDVEGDYIGEMKFTPDGSEIWVLNRTTNNITVIDWTTKQIAQNIPVGNMPMDIDFSDDMAVVACYSSMDVYFINLSDYSIAGIQPVDSQPGKVAVSSQGNIAVIGCDEPDIAEVFDLNTLSKTMTIDNFSFYLYKFSFITSNPRNSVYYSNFVITPDEQYLVNGADQNGLKFYELTTGQVATTIPEAGNAGQIDLSVDGNIVIAMKTGSPGVVCQLDVATQSLIKQISIPDVSIYSAYSPPAVNADGSKVLVSTYPGNNTHIDFNTDTWKHVETGISSDWLGRSVDGNYFVAGDYYLTIIDAETGNILSDLNGISIQNGNVGASNRIVASDPLRAESLFFYDFSSPAFLTFVGTNVTGSDLEADVAYSTTFTPDGSKVIVSNSLSGTLSVIDVETESLDKIIPLGSAETYHTAITSDGKYAVVSLRLNDQVAVIDLEQGQIVSLVPSGGSKPDQLFILPGDEFAYAINAGGADNIGVIRLDGASSSFETSFGIGNTGISWTNYGIRSDLKFTPDGTQAVLATPFDNKVQIIDLSNHSIAAEVDVEGFPLQVAIAPDDEFGNFAAVTLKNTSELAILAGEGNSWALVGKYPCANDPARVAYDPAKNGMWVVSSASGQAQLFSLTDFEFVEERNFGNDAPLAMLLSDLGRQFTLVRSNDAEIQPHHLIVETFGNSDTYDLASLPIHHFSVTPDGALAAIPHPGTDEVTLLKETPLGFEKIVVPLKALYHYYPNPVQSELHFSFLKGNNPYSSLTFQLFNSQGQLITTQKVENCSSFIIKRSNFWASGNYFFQLINGEKIVQSGKVIID